MSVITPVATEEAQVSVADMLQIALLALLPKSGEGRTVAWLAQETGLAPERITAALMDPYMAHAVDFDLRTDSYSLPRRDAARAPTPISSSERKEG